MKNNNFLLSLAAFLVLALGIMGCISYKQSLTTKISNKSIQIETIEKDLKDTNFDDLDTELKDIEAELE